MTTKQYQGRRNRPGQHIEVAARVLQLNLFQTRMMTYHGNTLFTNKVMILVASLYANFKQSNSSLHND